MNNTAVFATIALVIGLVVRLLKSDTPLPTVPPRWRPFLAITLGVVGGALDAIARGTPWQQALLAGVGSALTAMLGHELVVERLLGGREPGGRDSPTADELARDLNAPPVPIDREVPEVTDTFERKDGEQ